VTTDRPLTVEVQDRRTGAAMTDEGDLPPGLAQVEIAEAAAVFLAVHLTPIGGGPTTAELAALLGPGLDTSPRVFHLALPDAPFSCEVLALGQSGRLATTPGPHARATEIRLRRPPTGHAKRGR
jgi:hypothetical protein